MAGKKPKRKAKRGRRKSRVKSKRQRRKARRAPVVLEFRNPALKGWIQIELPPGWKKKELRRLTQGLQRKP